MKVTSMNPFSPRQTRPPAIEKQDYDLINPPSEKGFFRLNPKSFKKDDWILLGIIGALILDGSSDYTLLIALGYLFIMGTEPERTQ
jgi:hypothetical protein